jgi:hypothetical protein
MARLFRPHIPLKVRCQVAERQMEQAVKCLPTNEFGIHYRDDPNAKQGERLKAALFHLARILACEVSELRLDHDPPLAARKYREAWKGLYGKMRAIKIYIPDANDSDHLFYRPHGPEHAGSHLIKTLVRGDHGQHPDRVLIKKARRAERGPKPKRSPPMRSKKSTWPKRPFPKRREA